MGFITRAITLAVAFLVGLIVVFVLALLAWHALGLMPGLLTGAFGFIVLVVLAGIAVLVNVGRTMRDAERWVMGKGGD